MTTAPRIVEAPLGEGIGAWFTGPAERPDPAVGRAGNLSHHRPHVPAVLAQDRAAVGRATATDPAQWHLMDQVHGAEVAEVTADMPPGLELRGVDGMVTTVPGRVLGVATADCVPILLAGEETSGGAVGAVAAVHAGRRGVQAGVVAAAVAAVAGGARRAVVGPAIGGCCYEVPPEMQADVLRTVPSAEATTTWGTTSLDLPHAVVEQLQEHGVEVTRVGGCTRCEPGWFSHRADPGAGRQLGLVVRRD